eukprot:1948776-Rhodomonas_salina.1
MKRERKKEGGKRGGKEEKREGGLELQILCIATLHGWSGGVEGGGRLRAGRWQVIGPGGAMIRSLIEDFELINIDIDESGSVRLRKVPCFSSVVL